MAKTEEEKALAKRNKDGRKSCDRMDEELAKVKKLNLPDSVVGVVAAIEAAVLQLRAAFTV